MMENEDARKGFLTAVLKLSPNDIRETRIMKPYLRKVHEDDKLGILDHNCHCMIQEEKVIIIRFCHPNIALSNNRCIILFLKIGQSCSFRDIHNNLCRRDRAWIKNHGIKKYVFGY